MTTKQRIRKLKAEIADVEREIERLKALPKIDVYKVLCQAFARGLRGDEPRTTAGSVKPIRHSHET